MEQSRAGRARAYEQNRRKILLEGIKPPEVSDANVIFEDESLQKLDISASIRCDHAMSEACLRTLCTLVDRVEVLGNRGNEVFFPALLLYAETANKIQASHDEAGNECSSISQMSSFVDCLRDMYDFAHEVLQLFRNLVQQIRIFHVMDEGQLPGASSVQLRRCWRALGDLLAIFVVLDEIVLTRTVIKQHFTSFLRTVEVALHNPSQFGATMENLLESVETLRQIERALLCGNSLRNSYEQTLGDLDSCENFSDQMFDAVNDLYSRWEKSAENCLDEDIPDKRRLLVIVSLVAYYHQHFPNFAKKKLVKNVWMSHKRILSFHLLGDIVFVPCEFLLREVSNLSSIIDKKTLPTVQQARASLRTLATVEGMLSEATERRRESLEWVIELKAAIRQKEANPSQLARHSLKLTELMLKGVRLSDTMTRLLKTALTSFDGDTKITKRIAYSIFDVVETVKDISRLFASHWIHFSESCSVASQQWRCHVTTLLDSSRSSSKLDDVSDSALAVAVEHVLQTASRPRLSIISVALEVARIEALVKSIDLKQLEGLLTRIETVLQPRKLIQRVTNCSFLMYNKPLIALYWDTIFDRKPSNESVENFCSAISDCVDFCAKAQHIDVYNEETESIVQSFLGEHFEMIKKGFLGPLCGAIESDLRVLTHKHLSVDNRDRLSVEECAFLHQVLHKPLLRIYDQTIDVKEFASRYLERTFYNLTVVAPHDSLAYLNMADLAFQKYSLRLVDGNLLRGAIDESGDVIDVTRHLTAFVAQYNYCLNLQLFVEKESPNRTLRVLSLDQMTSSIRKHGIGVLATGVNMAYQVLRKKLNIFHQFLSDEHIRAQLQRDIRYFEENKEEFDKMYPLRRAEKFARQMAKFGGGNVDELTYMDKFRIIVTQIGNALGYVRTMTSSACAVLAEVSNFGDAEIFGELDLVDDGDEEAITGEGAVRRLREALEDLREQTGKTKDFAKMLVEVFRSSLSSPQFAHLSQFFVVVPALCTCHVEHMLRCRQRLRTRAAHNKEITFTDDGFSLGVAYLLSVLDIWPQFTSLNWFRSVLKTLEEQKTQQNGVNSKEIRGTHLKIDRLLASEKEYRLLLFTFQSARVFFSFDSWDD